MKEIEVKILGIDVDETIAKLKKLGAKKTFEGDIKASYYDYEDKSLSKDNKELRLRSKGEKIEFTFKQEISRGDAKIIDEREVLVNDHEQMKKILEGLNLKKKSLKIHKHRESYCLDGVNFELDTINNLPTYLEIEAESIEKIHEFVNKLGFDPQDVKPWTGKDVVEFYDKSKKIKN